MAQTRGEEEERAGEGILRAVAGDVDGAANHLLAVLGRRLGAAVQVGRSTPDAAPRWIQVPSVPGG